MAAQNDRDLVDWQKSMEFGEDDYRLTAGFPSDERFGLTVQLRRAAVNIPCKIAEGQGRATPRDFSRLLYLAHGSVREVETQVMLAERPHFVEPDRCTAILDQAAEIERMLNGLMNSLEKRYGEDWS
jgi:four helix bundle protein